MKRKVLIIHDSMEGGGAERVLVTLLSNIDLDRFDITLLLINNVGVFLPRIPAQVKVIGMYDRPKSLYYRLITHFYGPRNFLRERRARKLLGNNRFDVTVSFMEGAPGRLHQQLSDLASENITWVHNDLHRGRWYDFWFHKTDETRFYRSVGKIAFVSGDALKSFQKIFDTPATLRVIYNPVDSSHIRSQATAEKDLSDRRFTIVNVGRFVPQKNHHRLIEAAEILRNKGCDFVIKLLGSGPLEDRIKEEVKKRGLENHVEFLGFRANPFPVVADASVFCMTSDYEGYPMVITEALTLGVPVVATPVTGVKEMLAHGGGILTSFEASDIADILERLIRNPEQLSALKADAATSSRQFDMAAIMGQITEFLG